MGGVGGITHHPGWYHPPTTPGGTTHYPGWYQEKIFNFFRNGWGWDSLIVPPFGYTTDEGVKKGIKNFFKNLTAIPKLT